MSAFLVDVYLFCSSFKYTLTCWMFPQAREAVEMRAQVEKKMAQKEKEKKEEKLRELAQMARDRRAGIKSHGDKGESQQTAFVRFVFVWTLRVWSSLCCYCSTPVWNVITRFVTLLVLTGSASCEIICLLPYWSFNDILRPGISDVYPYITSVHISNDCFDASQRLYKWHHLSDVLLSLVDLLHVAFISLTSFHFASSLT